MSNKKKEEVIEHLKKEFYKSDYIYTRDNKVAFAIGYLKNNEKVNRYDAIDILEDIFFKRI